MATLPVGTALEAALVLIAGTFLLRRLLKDDRFSQLPPGPKPLPLIGNITDMPSSQEWITFAEWGKKWGGICSVTLMGRPMIIVNSVRVLDELDRKGAIYSDRPTLHMGGELVGYSKTLVLLRYGPQLRVFRRYFSQLIGSGSVKRFEPALQAQVRHFIKRVLKTPDNLLAHLRKLTGGIILKLTYGIEVQDGEDPFVNLIEDANRNFNAATVPGAFLVDFFPSLLHVPEWLPGMGFKKLARVWARATLNMVDVPYNYTRYQMAAGTAPVSFVSQAIEGNSKLTENEISDIKFTASSMYGGGADTSVSAQYAFFLAMVLYPDVQKQAQAEIDAVIGPDRLPTFSDRDSLPYLTAVLTEVLRWNSVAPTGVPHTAMEDGIIDGFLIPKNSIIVANLWNMLHDPEMYPDPFAFDPTRHIATDDKPAQSDPRKICFGYGRRVCPGMHLAEASLFITFATSLAVFDIGNAVDDHGAPIIPVHENTSGTISYPKEFKCSIKPRSPKALALITDEH